MNTCFGVMQAPSPTMAVPDEPATPHQSQSTPEQQVPSGPQYAEAGTQTEAPPSGAEVRGSPVLPASNTPEENGADSQPNDALARAWLPTTQDQVPLHC